MSADAPATLRSRALRGTLWVLMGTGAGQVLRLVSNLILSRLLFPEAFGLMAIVNLVTQGLQMVSNVGIRPAIIRHADGARREFLDTAWTLQIARGAVLGLVCLLLAAPLARYYGQPELTALVAAAALVPFIDGFLSTRLSSLTRQLDLRGTVAVGLLAQAVSIAGMVAFALWYRSVWALVIGSIVFACANVLLSHWLLPGERDRLRLDRGHAREILVFGQWILVSTLFTFFARKVDVVLLGRWVTMDLLGVYSIGLMLAAILQQIFGQLAQRVLMPALSESHRTEEGRLERSLFEAKRVLLPAGALALLAGVGVSPAFFHYLYDARYADAGWIAQLALLPLWTGLIHEANGRALLALGDSRSWALSNILRTAVAAAGCAVGFRLAGLPGLMLGLAAGGVAGSAAVAIALRRRDVRTGAYDLRVGLLAAAAGGLCALAPHWLGADADARPLLTLALGVVMFAPPALWLAARHRSRLLGPSSKGRPG